MYVLKSSIFYNLKRIEFTFVFLVVLFVQNKTFGDLSPETESYEFVKSQEVDTSTCSIDTEPPSPLEEELAELGKNGAVIEKVILEEPVAEEANTSLRQRKIDKVEED